MTWNMVPHKLANRTAKTTNNRHDTQRSNHHFVDNTTLSEKGTPNFFFAGIGFLVDVSS